jgi:excisionase family DNA binding protein
MDLSKLPNLLTIKQACEALNCHPNTLRNWEREGLIKSVRFGVRKDRRFSKSEINRLLENKDETNIESQLLPTNYDLSRIEMTGTRYEGVNPDADSKYRDILDKQEIKEFNYNKLLNQQTENIKYFEKHELDKYLTLEEKILHIITANRYRNGSLELINLKKYSSKFLNLIRQQISEKKPIVFMMPAFPFKVANPLKSLRRDADLAEIGAFLRFNEINLQIKKIYTPSAKFIIFHDGHLYYRHFLNEKADADRYFKTLKKFITKMKLEKVIGIRDANFELKKIPNFPDILKESRQEINNLWKKEKRNNEKVQKIIESSKNNLNLADIPYELVYKINMLEDWDLATEERKIKKDIEKRAENCAFEYMVVQHALEKCNFFEKLVPEGIRLTVHPKEGQIGIYLVKRKTHLLPWMGVGVLKNNGEVSVHYESELLSSSKYYPVFIKGEKYPFYYKEAEIIYKGLEEFKKLFENVIRNLDKSDFYWAFAFNTEYMDLKVREIFSEVHEKLENKKIEDKVICLNKAQKVIEKTFQENKNIQIKALSEEIPTGVVILKDRIINLLWGKEPSAYEIKAPEIVSRYKAYFKELWEK